MAKKRGSCPPSPDGGVLAGPVSPQVLHERIRDLLLGIGAYRGRPDPLMEACLACLEAAESISGLLTRPGEGGAEHGQDALHAARAAVVAVRIAIVAEGDNRRLPAKRFEQRN